MMRKLLAFILCAVVLVLGLLVVLVWLVSNKTAPLPEVKAEAAEETPKTAAEVWAEGADGNNELLPEPEPLPEGEPVVLNGAILQTVQQAGADYARSDEIAAALGLEFSGDSTAAIFGGTHAAAFYELDTCVQWDGYRFELTNGPITYDKYLYLPVQQLAEALQYDFYRDNQTQQLYLTSGAGAWDISREMCVPVLAYHAISDDVWGMPEMFLSPSAMEEQLIYLTEHGYDPIWFEDLAHLEDYDKPLLLTFDDGYDDNYTQLFPLLQKYRVKATIFVIGGSLGAPHKMTREQVREMADSGLVSIQSHGMTHHKMQEMTEKELEYELAESCRILAEVTGRRPYAVSYPNGAVSDLSLELAQKYYRFGVRTNNTAYWTSDDPILINRFNVGPADDMVSFAEKLANAGLLAESS